MAAVELPLIRQSERADFKACPKKWEWRWVDGWVQRTPKLDARWFGTLWHLLWATVYTPPGKDGFERAINRPSEIHALWDELTKEAYTTVAGQPYWGDDEEMEYNDAAALGHIMIDGQLKEWNLDPNYEVLVPEQRFRVKVPYNSSQKDRPVLRPDLFPVGNAIGIVVGTYDLPVRDHNTTSIPPVILLDWKTTSRRENRKDLNKDDQTGTYIVTARTALVALGLISPDEPVEYMVFSFARKAKPPEETKLVDSMGRVRNKPNKAHYQLVLGLAEADIKGMSVATLQQMVEKTYPGRVVFGEVAKNQGSPLFWRDVVRRNKDNRRAQVHRLADDLEMTTLARAGEIPILKTPGDHCNWCDYTDLCDIDEDGGDTHSFIQDVFKYEDPYADHRKNADNSKRSILDRKD